jgi:two-component system CheB/CheR fusion protein
MLSAQPFIEFPVSPAISKPFEIMKKTGVKNITQLAEKVILKYYAPNCVIITEKGEITYIHGRTGKYLELMNGEAKMNIFEMAREGLQQELPALVRKASTQKKSLTVEGIKVKFNGHSQLINLTVKPIKEPEAMSGSFLIIFEDILPGKKEPALKRTRNAKKSGNIIKELERELSSTKENLKTIIEEPKHPTRNLNPLMRNFNPLMKRFKVQMKNWKPLKKKCSR